ncbi:helix-turn-helix domain-containing protein [Azospirillum humicireducens]|uniref:Helix-turn-helix domain-containing protein n=1 Tax=Azospirillum humicireducens TaxID=1226968 RepID=A0A160JFZ7_9PROT|nr:helix-turn-helix domain-containing protein [Azospirillum humicireducens]ANC91852.1 helix-turn-helix domain-containing protein [Azospirillum humicireducens]
MDVRPIRSDEDHATALEEIERLWGADPDTDDGARLEILMMLVDAYEEANHPIPPSDPISAIEFMMDQRGLTRHDLEPMIGSRARVAEILNRKRALTLPMIRRLSEGLKIPVDILVRDYPVKRAA